MKMLLLSAPLIILLIAGCTEKATEPDLTSPGNLNITLIEKGAGLKLEWDAVAEANGYFIYFGTSPDTMHAIVKIVGGEFFYDDSSELDTRGTGYYGVLAVGGEYDSVVGPMSGILRTAPYLMEDVVLYERDYSNGDFSAFGWDASGTGRVLSITDDTNIWHVYLSDGKPGESDSLELKFVSPTDAVGTDTPPPVSWGTTFIQASAKSFAPLEISTHSAPEVGIAEEETYYLFVDDQYYAKFFIKDVFSNGVTFDAYLQTFFEYDQTLQDSVGLRRF
jgi:hypothetical protein